MQKLNLLSAKVKRLGGTANKADWEDEGKLYSAKHKGSLSRGSFDWVNTSKLGGIWSTWVEEFYQEAKELAAPCCESRADERRIQAARDLFSETSNGLLDGCSSENLKTFLNEHLVDNNRGITCVITESSKRRLFVFPLDNHPAVKMLRQGYDPILVGYANGSRKVFFTDGTNEIDSGLRFRIALNNGVKALLGLARDRNGRKKYSYIVAKLQQDNVLKLVEQSQADIHRY